MLQPQVLQAMQGFMLGTTAFVSWTACATLAGVLTLCISLASVFAKVLDALSLGESTAQSLGVPLPLARMVLVGVISLATGAAVAHIGLVAFVGLAAPHLVRSLVRCTHAWRLLLSALMGGALLVLADVMARVLFAPQELPVGVLTAVLGGGYLLWRVYRDADNGTRTGGGA
jgi:iron complex transport system permease protein